MSEKDPVEQAQELLRLDPLPEDAEQRLDDLYEKASDEEKTLFAGLYEALIVKQGPTE